MKKTQLLLSLLFFVLAGKAQVFEQNPEKVYVYKLIEGNRIFYQWHHFVYNAEKKISSRISSKKGAADSLSKELFFYNKHGQIIQNEYWGFENNTWLLINASRTNVLAHYLTSKGDSLPFISTSERYESKEWTPLTRIEYQYNAKDKPILVRFFVLNGGQPPFENRKDSLVYNASGDTLVEWYVYEISARGLVLTQKYSDIIGIYTGSESALSQYHLHQFDVNTWRLAKTKYTRVIDALGSNTVTYYSLLNDSLKPSNQITQKIDPSTLSTERLVVENGNDTGFIFSYGNYYSYEHQAGEIKRAWKHNLKANLQPDLPYEEYVYNPTFPVRVEEAWLENRTIVYPNPTMNEIYLNGNIEKGTQLTLIDMLGNTVGQWVYEEKEINVAYLNSGVYFLVLNSDLPARTIVKLLKK